MEIRQFNYFMTVTKLGSFTQDSEELRISQSALSKTIMSLEIELGMELMCFLY
ncbi:LysR family transcriptional regulator [Mammaliicoccus lentus]|uniref:LysR family transcriptional regulator n=2 Tax=Mammaliicoccus lentus TaxID=42858 RepID=A0AAX3W4A7_MAMLE|nr:LysR family transcriptional regulator [Mammaliicoccus lentus]WHI60088.1 LysR family transcriptional regulator [Mammaliicoccus lentus]